MFNIINSTIPKKMVIAIVLKKDHNRDSFSPSFIDRFLRIR